MRKFAALLAMIAPASVLPQPQPAPAFGVASVRPRAAGDRGLSTVPLQMLIIDHMEKPDAN